MKMQYITSLGQRRGAAARGAALAALATALLAAGCASSDLLEPEGPVAIEVSLDKKTYRPGEAAVCTVALTNRSGEDVDVQVPNFASLRFYYGPVGTDVRLERPPVASPLEPAGQTVSVRVDETVYRRFVLTRVTQDVGSQALHVVYKSGKADVDRGIGVIARAVPFAVKGVRRFARDSEGLLMAADAKRVARKAAGAEEAAVAEARLIRNEAGFLDWWVDVQKRPAGSARAKAEPKSFFVNPYTGRVRTAAKPHGSRQALPSPVRGSGKS
jgi:hypothetical protein